MTQTNTAKLRDDMMYLHGQLQALGFLVLDGSKATQDLFETISEQYRSVMQTVFEMTPSPFVALAGITPHRTDSSMF